MSLLVLHYVDSSRPGGIESHLAALLPALRRMDVDARLLFHADHGPHPLRDRLDQLGVPHRTLSGGVGGLARHLRTARPAVLHTHGYKAGLLGRAARRLGGPPVVSTMHSGDLGAGRVRLYNALDAATARLSRAIVVSPALAARFPGAALIPNGVETPADAPMPGEAVGFVGRFADEKGPLDFVEIARGMPGLRFLAFGDGPLHAEAAGAAPPNLDLRGAVPAMDPHWREIGLLVMPSRFEGLPMAALEAMARGVPVAAYAVGALPELLGDGCGLLVPPGDRAALSGAVLRWSGLAPADRLALAARVQARVRGRYGIEACARATLAVYEDMLGAAPVAAGAA